ncbi:MAG: prolipoprotein diacylglyceryl transferase [Acidimicrobiales bacterium]
MRPIPVSFHVGPLVVHTYGIGLALTFWFALRYFERRLRDNGYPSEWLNGAFLWIIGAAIVGARVVHVLSMFHYYAANPGQIVAIWNGGLSSYGGLLGGIPTGLWLAHRRCPQLPLWQAMDLLAPVLMASWAIGRLLGPQLMISGGGHPTHSWIGMYYAGEVGKRLPVPLFQAAESFGVWVCLVTIERWKVSHGGPVGLLLASMATLWDVTRFFDQYLWLATPKLWDQVEVASIVLAAGGLVAGFLLLRRHLRRQRAAEGMPERLPHALGADLSSAG